MMEFVEFVFSSFWRFCGAVILLEIIISPLQALCGIKNIIKIGRNNDERD